MNKKVILTEQQHTLIINQILKETVDKIDEMEPLVAQSIFDVEESETE